MVAYLWKTSEHDNSMLILIKYKYPLIGNGFACVRVLN